MVQAYRTVLKYSWSFSLFSYNRQKSTILVFLWGWTLCPNRWYHKPHQFWLLQQSSLKFFAFRWYLFFPYQFHFFFLQLLINLKEKVGLWLSWQQVFYSDPPTTFFPGWTPLLLERRASSKKQDLPFPFIRWGSSQKSSLLRQLIECN